MTLKELHTSLQDVDQLAYSALSELLNTGDIASQLGVTGTGARRNIPETALSILREFLPNYRQAGIRANKAPDALRVFLRDREGAGGAAGGLTLVTQSPNALGALATSNETMILLHQIATNTANTVRHDKLIGREEAAELLHCSPNYVAARLRQGTQKFGAVEVKAVYRGVYRYSDLQEHLAGLQRL